MGTDATRVVVASYNEVGPARDDWAGLVKREEDLNIVDAALTTKDSGDKTHVLDRQDHHGWYKGAVAGAVVALVAPATLVAGLVGGAATGAVIARFKRGLDRGDLRRIGEMLDLGQSVIVIVTDEESLNDVEALLGRSTRIEVAEGKVTWTREDFERDFSSPS